LLRFEYVFPFSNGILLLLRIAAAETKEKDRFGTRLAIEPQEIPFEARFVAYNERAREQGRDCAAPALDLSDGRVKLVGPS
jgi:hypothetical protein